MRKVPVTDVLGLAKKHQTGRVTEKVTNVTFTEGWFRHRSRNRQRTSKREGGEKIRHGGFHRRLVPRQLIENTVANVLELAKVHQSGRTTENVAIATFTEGWFRHRSGNRQRTSKREGGEKIRHGGFHRGMVPRQWRRDFLNSPQTHQNGPGRAEIHRG